MQFPRLHKRNGTLADQMDGPEYILMEAPLGTHEERDIEVGLIAPARPGRYRGTWRMHTPEGDYFGRRLKVKLRVCGCNGEVKGLRVAWGYN